MDFFPCLWRAASYNCVPNQWWQGNSSLDNCPRTSAPKKVTAEQLPPGQFPPRINRSGQFLPRIVVPLEQLSLGQFSLRIIAPSKLPPGKYPPRIIAPFWCACQEAIQLKNPMKGELFSFTFTCGRGLVYTQRNEVVFNLGSDFTIEYLKHKLAFLFCGGNEVA